MNERIPAVPMTLRCLECKTEWRVEVRIDDGPHICPNTACPKRARDLAIPWVAEYLKLHGLKR